MKSFRITPIYKDDPSGIVELIIKTNDYYMDNNGVVERVYALGYKFKDDMFNIKEE